MELIDIFPIALVALFVWGVKPVRPFASQNSDYLSVETGRNLRGFFALTVILHHLSQHVEGLSVFSHAGYLSVAIFFFLSGYGLQKSHMMSDKYKNHFLLRRLSRILFPYVVVTVMFFGVHAFAGMHYSMKDIILAIAKGEPIVPYSWFIISILLFYIAFWVLMQLCRENYLLMFCGACVWYVAYVAFCVKMGYISPWYSASHLLLVGMLWALYEERIVNILRKYYRVIAPTVFTMLFLTSHFSERITGGISIKGFGFLQFSFLIGMVSAVFFVLSVLVFTFKFKIGNPVLSFVGRNSLEIYLVQGVFIIGLRNSTLYIKSDFLWAWLAVLGSVALGSGLNFVLGRFLTGRWQRISCGFRRAEHDGENQKSGDKLLR